MKKSGSSAFHLALIIARSAWIDHLTTMFKAVGLFVPPPDIHQTLMILISAPHRAIQKGNPGASFLLI
jgi:hypothetical protein